MDLKNMTVGEFMELSKLFTKVTETSASSEIDCGIRIAILQRGWVCVGRYFKCGDEVALKGASVIRIWGTTKGIGEIATAGPLSGTKLDVAGTVRFNKLAEIASVQCDESKWKAYVS